MGLGLAFLVNVRVGSETEGKNFGRKKKKYSWEDFPILICFLIKFNYIPSEIPFVFLFLFFNPFIGNFEECATGISWKNNNNII